MLVKEHKNNILKLNQNAFLNRVKVYKYQHNINDKHALVYFSQRKFVYNLLCHCRELFYIEEKAWLTILKLYF